MLIHQIVSFIFFTMFSCSLLSSCTRMPIKQHMDNPNSVQSTTKKHTKPRWSHAIPAQHMSVGLDGVQKVAFKIDDGYMEITPSETLPNAPKGKIDLKYQVASLGGNINVCGGETLTITNKGTTTDNASGGCVANYNIVAPSNTPIAIEGKNVYLKISGMSFIEEVSAKEILYLNIKDIVNPMRLKAPKIKAKLENIGDLYLDYTSGKVEATYNTLPSSSPISVFVRTTKGKMVLCLPDHAKVYTDVPEGFSVTSDFEQSTLANCNYHIHFISNSGNLAIEKYSKKQSANPRKSTTKIHPTK